MIIFFFISVKVAIQATNETLNMRFTRYKQEQKSGIKLVSQWGFCGGGDYLVIEDEENIHLCKNNFKNPFHFQFTRKRTQSTNNINLFLHGIIIVNGWSKYFDYNIASGETPMIHIRVVINNCRKLHWVNTQIHQTLVKLKGKRVSLSWPTSNIRRERR